MSTVTHDMPTLGNLPISVLYGIGEASRSRLVASYKSGLDSRFAWLEAMQEQLNLAFGRDVRGDAPGSVVLALSVASLAIEFAARHSPTITPPEDFGIPFGCKIEARVASPEDGGGVYYVAIAEDGRPLIASNDTLIWTRRFDTTQQAIDALNERAEKSVLDFAGDDTP